MGGCCAPNCNNSTKKGVRLFIFPRNPERRAKWLQMCRRDKWQPTLYSVLYEMHFEDSQFEKTRANGWKKLKLNAVPIIFNVPNCPKQLTPKRRILQRVTSGKVTQGEVPSGMSESLPNPFEMVSCEMDLDTRSTIQSCYTEKEEDLISKIKTLERRLWSTQKPLQKTRIELRQLRKNISSFPILK